MKIHEYKVKGLPMSKQVDINIEHADNYMQNISATIRQTQTAMENMNKQVKALAQSWTDNNGRDYQNRLLQDIKRYEEAIERLNRLHKFTKEHTDRARDIRDYGNAN